MKNVWILNHYAQEPGGAGGTRHFSLARHLRNHGWNASIIASNIELNTGRDRLMPGERARLDLFDGVPFLWLRTPGYEGNGRARIRNMLMYAWHVLRPDATKCLDRPDLILGSSVHPLAAWAGALLASRHRVPFVFEVRDLWPQTLIDLGRLKASSPTAKALAMLERWLYRRADKIIVLLPGASEYIAPMGIPSERIVWIPNGVEMCDYPQPSPPQGDGMFTLMYFGAHGQANGLDCVLRAMAVLNGMPDASHIRLRLIGDGPLKVSLIKLASELGLTNVTFEPPVPKRVIPKVAAEASAFVFNLVDAPVFKFGISSNKLFDFFAAGRPIVFSCGASNNPVQDANAGVTVRPGDPLALAEAIVQMARLSPDQRWAMGMAGRGYVEKNHDFSILGRILADVLSSMIQRNSVGLT